MRKATLEEITQFIIYDLLLLLLFVGLWGRISENSKGKEVQVENKQ